MLEEPRPNLFLQIHNYLLRKRREPTKYEKRLFDFKQILLCLKGNLTPIALLQYLQQASSFKPTFGTSTYHTLRERLKELSPEELQEAFEGYIQFLVEQSRTFEPQSIRLLLSSRPLAEIETKHAMVPLKEEPVDITQLATDTFMLARQLKQVKPQDELYPCLKTLALGIITEFARQPIKSTALIQETVALAGIEDKEINHALLETFTHALRDAALFQPELLDGLTTIISKSNPALLVADDCVQILRIINARKDTLHRQEQDETLLQIMQAIARLLDAMADANVRDLQLDQTFRDVTTVMQGTRLQRSQLNELHQSFNASLQELKSHRNSRLAAKAAYAQQSFVRLPHSGNKWKTVIGKTLVFSIVVRV